jgi:hypothetical protein
MRAVVLSLALGAACSGSGNLTLVDPDSLAVTTFSGFSAIGDYSGGHDDGPTSVDEGRGLLFVTDRTSQKLDVVDPKSGTIVASAPVSASPDYVRYVAPTDEVWISEPAGAQIEIFSLPKEGTSSVATIAVSNGPESLVIDASAGRA